MTVQEIRELDNAALLAKVEEYKKELVKVLKNNKFSTI